MKMTLNLTNEEGMNVVAAMRDAAINKGWRPEELADCEVMEDYAEMLDVALKAMGIELVIHAYPEEEEEEEEEKEEEDNEELPSDDEVLDMIKELFRGW